jgi:PAS domain S-box-containing protein
MQTNQLQFQRLLDKLPAGAYTCDAEGLITYFNEQAIQIWGREPKLNDSVDRYCGSFRLFAVDGSPLRHDQCWMALALQTGRGFNREEIVIERPNGSRINALAHANPIHDDLGSIIGAVNVLVDISDRRQAEDAKVLLASIVESSDDAIVSKTLEGRILTWNKGAERLFGFTEKEAVGSNIGIIIPPDRLDEEQDILSRLRQGKRIDHYETVRMSKNGRQIDVSLSISPIRNSTGCIIGASKVARDITARKQGDVDLQRLHEMSSLLASTLELPIILDGTLRTVAEIEQTDRGLLLLWDNEKHRLQVGANLGFEETFIRWVENSSLDSSASGMCFSSRKRIIIDDIEHRDTLPRFRDAARRAGFRAVHSIPLISRRGLAIGVLSVHFKQPYSPSHRIMRLADLCSRQAVDFIEGAQLYEQQKESNRYKDEFLATLAHELRNPLAPLSNSLNLLRLCDDVPPVVEEMRDIMEHQVSQMGRLIDDLLEVSRISRGKLELRKERVDLSAIISRAVETSRPLIDAAGHQLAITLPSARLELDADAARLIQVVANLLNNAAKYMDREGQIWLTVQPEKAEAVISVRDAGIGISAEMLPQVFGMFAQLGKTGHTKSGLGIGLALAKHLVELHGGSIVARSDGPGMGSEFTVRLPLVGKKRASRVASPRPQVVRKPLPNRRILIVDDTHAAVYVLGKLLGVMGQSVHTEQNAKLALEYVRIERPDIVISDIGMPEMDGYDFARSIRRQPELNDVILVALTGYGQESDRRAAKEAGFDYHIVKPVSVEALHNLLAEASQRSDSIISVG